METEGIVGSSGSVWCILVPFGGSASTLQPSSNKPQVPPNKNHKILIERSWRVLADTFIPDSEALIARLRGLGEEVCRVVRRG